MGGGRLACIGTFKRFRESRVVMFSRSLVVTPRRQGYCRGADLLTPARQSSGRVYHPPPHLLILFIKPPYIPVHKLLRSTEIYLDAWYWFENCCMRYWKQILVSFPVTDRKINILAADFSLHTDADHKYVYIYEKKSFWNKYEAEKQKSSINKTREFSFYKLNFV